MSEPMDSMSKAAENSNQTEGDTPENTEKTKNVMV